MAQTVQAGQTTTDRVTRPELRETTAWAGLVGFAGAMLMLAGFMQGLYGLIAIFNDEWVVFGNQHNLLLDLTAWGWIHLATGIVLMLIGIGVLLGNSVARGAGVVVAGISALVNFMVLPAYPLWGLVIITLDVFVIYALIAHGRELDLR